jgi:hypothetical protein
MLNTKIIGIQLEKARNACLHFENQLQNLKYGSQNLDQLIFYPLSV